MCPLGNKCANYMGLRWPSSDTPCTTKVGQKCPYAHHYSELEFPQTLEMRKTGNKNAEKRDINAVPPTFRKGGELYDCQGCSRCNLCKYKIESQKIIADMTAKVLNKKTDKDKIETRKKFNDQKVDSYTKKFGILKKASILLFYGRANEAFDKIVKACKIIQNENDPQDEDERKFKERERERWGFKLGIEQGFELPNNKTLDTVTPEDLTDQFIKDCLEQNQGVDAATVKLYL